jgi:hypothetical protein
LEIQVPIMGKGNVKVPDFKVTVPDIQEEEKEPDASDGKPPSVKLLLDAKGEAIDNTMIQVHHIFNVGTTEQFFKWFNSLSSIMEGHLVGEHYRVALQSLWGTDNNLW